jgi:hypothetical protein
VNRYNEVMGETRNVVEGSTVGTSIQAGRIDNVTIGSAGLTTVAVAARWLHSTGVLARDTPRRFTGRTWVLDEIDRFLREQSSGYLVVEGGAGVGKTALAAWLMTERDYCGHLTRLPNGQLVSTAIRHLGAQLIHRYGLQDPAPGGVLPALADGPGWFDRVLGEAAQRHCAGGAGSPLVLVVDGLDEAEQVRGRFPLGLPAGLPEGVVVVVTGRTGIELPGLREPYRVVRIRADDPRNLEDMRRHVVELATAPPLADRLATACVGTDRFADELTARCGGVWIYLRQVLEELGSDRRRPDQLDELPSDLTRYYADNVRSLRDDTTAWDELHLPLLSALAVAAEPVGFSTLTGLAGVRPDGRARAVLNNRLRAFLSVFPGEPEGRYALYHSSLRDFLHGEWEAYGPDSETTFAEELRSAVHTAHARVAERYVAAWGGVDQGLPALSEAPRRAETDDDGYGLRHLIEHLTAAGRHGDIHRVLSAEQARPGAQRVNTWYHVHDAANAVQEYLDDVARARRLAEERTDQQYAAGEPATGIGLEVRYALIESSIATLSGQLPLGVLVRLVELGRWSPERALTHVAQLGNPRLRARAFIGIAGQCDPWNRDIALRLAAEEAARIEDVRMASITLTELAPVAIEDTMPTVLDVLDRIDSEQERFSALRALIAQGPATAVDALLDRARRLGDRTLRIRSFVTALDRVSEAVRRDLRAEIDAEMTGATPDDLIPAPELIAYVDEKARRPLLVASLVKASRVQHPVHREDILRGVAQHLDPAVVDEARAQVSEGFLREVTQIAPPVVPDPAEQVLILSCAAELFAPPPQVQAQIAAAAPASAFARALGTATDNEYARSRIVVNLAPHLPTHLLPQAVSLARSVGMGRFRADALTSLVPHLPAQDRPSIADEALTACLHHSDASELPDRLQTLAPHLRPRPLSQALREGIATTMADPNREAYVPKLLSALAPALPPALLDEALAVAATIGDAEQHAPVLAACTPFMSEPERTDLVGEALKIARDCQDAGWRACTTAAITATVAPEHRVTAVDQLLAVTPHIPPGFWVSRTLEEIGPVLRELPPDTTYRIVDAAVAERGPGVLHLLVPHLPASLLAPALEAIGNTEAMWDEPCADLSGAFAHGIADAATADSILTAIASFRNDHNRALALAEVAAVVPEDLVSRAADLAAAIRPEESQVPDRIADARAMAFGALAPRLPEPRRGLAFREALRVFHPRSTVGMTSGSFRILARLTPHLTRTELAAAWETARCVPGHDDRARSLGMLVSRLSHAEREQAISEVLSTVDAIRYGDKVLPLAELAAVAPDVVLDRALTRIHEPAAVRGDAMFPWPSVLRTTAPHRPAALWAFASAPMGAEARLDIFLAALSHAPYVNWFDAPADGFGPLRRCFDGLPRKNLFELLRASLEVIAEQGGDHAVEECARAVRNVTAWWP